MMTKTIDCIVIGGGASGFFFAINYAIKNPKQSIVIIEKSSKVLQKVKISGGGRCNVTHAEFIPKDLSDNYPRGKNELLGPFHQFMTADMMAWLEERGVRLKIEKDGRVFPASDSSQSIIDCFVNECRKYKIHILTSQGVNSFYRNDGLWEVDTTNKKLKSSRLVLASGSSLKMWKLIEKLGHKVVPPTPSLFTFHINHPHLKSMQGLSLPTHITLYKTASNKKKLLESFGPTLITHWGLSGPCILKLSAWGSKILHNLQYQCTISINWLPNIDMSKIESDLKLQKSTHAKKNIDKQFCFDLPKRFWLFILQISQVQPTKKWADLDKKEIRSIVNNLTSLHLKVNGKSTFKEEFVTAGGVELKEINFKNFSSKILPYFKITGEALNIDAITGGFNFQNAWTSAYIAATTDWV